jgi:hypothetical protein
MKSIGFCPRGWLVSPSPQFRRPSVQHPRRVLPYRGVANTEDLAKRNCSKIVSRPNTESKSPFSKLVYLPYHVHVVGTEWHRHFTKGVRTGRHLVVLLVWVASCAPHGHHTSISIYATVSLPPTPRPALTKRVSELFPGEGFRSNTDFENKFPFPVRTIAVTRLKEVIQLVLRRSFYAVLNTKLVGNFYGLGDVFCC